MAFLTFGAILLRFSDSCRNSKYYLLKQQCPIRHFIGKVFPRSPQKKSPRVDWLVRTGHKPHPKLLVKGNRITLIVLNQSWFAPGLDLLLPKHLDKIWVLLARKEQRNGWCASNQVYTLSRLIQFTFPQNLVKYKANMYRLS